MSDKEFQKNSNVNETDKKKKHCFQVMSGKDIQMSEDTQEDFLVDGLITPGLNILAAPRKKGKSWFALDLALCISGGKDFWGRKTKHGKVLLFALEDTMQRLKIRINEQLDYEDAPDDLLVSYATEAYGDEFYKDLDDYLTENPDIIFVIVDVMQKIRSDKKSNETEYSHDYRDVGHLKKIADSHKISLLVITHTRKTEDKKDRLNEIAGGVGVTGVADTILMICGNRSMDSEQTLYITGRDIQENELVIAFDKDFCKWLCKGNKEELNVKKDEEVYASSPIVKVIKALMEKNGGKWIGTSRELLEYGLKEMGEPIAKSESALARKINRFDECFLKDSIGHQRPDPNGGFAGRKHIFIRIDKDNHPPKAGKGVETIDFDYSGFADSMMIPMEEE